MKIKKTLTHSTFYLLITKPNFYLKRLASKTILIGLFSFLVNYITHINQLDKFTVPAGMHSVIGVVIGLLLVFRINTAYDRWWEGRKTISLIAAEIGIMSARLGTVETVSNQEHISSFKTTLKIFLESMRDYLKVGDDGKESSIFHLHQKRVIQKAMKELHEMHVSDTIMRTMDGSLAQLLEYSNSLERIKNTPIPLSYVLHIRLSILIYIISLPFGLFHELGMWSSLMVMLVYYIISGVEIISNEIENPFGGEPNDLPMETLFENIIFTLKDEENHQ